MGDGSGWSFGVVFPGGGGKSVSGVTINGNWWDKII